MKLTKSQLKEIIREELLKEIKVGTIVNPRFANWQETIDFNYGNQLVSLDKKAFEALLKIYKQNKSKIK